MLTEPLSQSFGQPFIIENRPGASGNLGVDLVLKSSDQHTLGFTTNGPLTASQWLYKELPYNPHVDLRPISLVAQSPLIFVVRSDSPIRTLREFVAQAKSSQEKLKYGSVGIGSASHLMGELLKWQGQFDMKHVPLQSFPQVVSEILGKRLDGAFVVPTLAWPPVRDGKLRMLAVSTSTRSQLFPDVPSAAEALGLPKLGASVWVGFFGPRSLPSAAVHRLNEELTKILQTDQIRKQLAEQGWIGIGGPISNMHKRISDDSGTWGGVVRITGAALD